MRILYVSTLYPNRCEPTRATYSRSLVEAFRTIGHEVEVIAPLICVPGERLLRGGGMPPLREEIGGVTVWHPPFYRTPGCLIHWHHHYYRLSVRSCFRRVTASFRPDHVIAGFAYPDGTAVGALCLEAGLPYSVQVRGSDFHVRRRQPRFAPILFDTLARAPLIVCSGQSLAQAMADAGVEAAKIVSYRNGVDQARFHPPDTPPAHAPRTALFVGNLYEVKGVDRLVPAWQRLRDTHPDREWRLDIVGHGPMRTDLEREIAAADLQDTITLSGPLPHDAVAQRLRDAHCLILPSRSEGMPNVVVEALASGLPVVATRVGEVPLLLDDGINGAIVEPDADDLVGDLAHALSRVLDQPWDRQAIARSVAGMTWETTAETIVRAIETRGLAGGAPC